MATLGFRSVEEMIGRVDKLEINPDVLHYKSRGLDLSALLTPATSLNENHSGVSKTFEQARDRQRDLTKMKMLLTQDSC